jgi:hypothetical protein
MYKRGLIASSLRNQIDNDLADKIKGKKIFVFDCSDLHNHVTTITKAFPLLSDRLELKSNELVEHFTLMFFRLFVNEDICDDNVDDVVNWLLDNITEDEKPELLMLWLRDYQLYVNVFWEAHLHDLKMHLNQQTLDRLDFAMGARKVGILIL